MHKLLPIIFLILFISDTQAQFIPNNEHTKLCGQDDQEKSLMQNEEYRKSKLNYEKQYQSYINNLANTNKSFSVVHRIPTIVHIIHNGSTMGTDENPTDDMIYAAITEASDRFRHQHATAQSYTNPAYGTDTEIELCMAKVDPQGNYTSGVLRYYDPVNTNNPSSTYLSSLMWDPNLYNNIFIAKSIGGACGVANNTYTKYLASCFNPGLVCHEIGHLFSLYHTFSGNCINNDCLTDGDKVCDTPPKVSSGYRSPNSCSNIGNSCTSDEDDLSTNNPYRPIANGGIGDQVDMYANYMDYTGNCWDSFTQGQKDRMKFNITNYRNALANNSSVVCTNAIAVNDIGVQGINLNQMSTCQNQIAPTITIKNYGSSTTNSFEVHFYLNGTLMHSQNENVTISATGTTTITASTTLNIPLGNSLLSVKTSLPNNTSDENIHNDINYKTATYVGGGTCSNCEEIQSYMCPLISMTAPQNDPSLNLSIPTKYGNKIPLLGTAVDFNNPITNPLLVFASSTSTSCATLGNNLSDSIKFQVSATGNFNIKAIIGSGSPTVVSIFNDQNISCSSFISSNAFETSNGAISWYFQQNVPLSECTDYWAVVYDINNYGPTGKLTIGPNNAWVNMPHPTGYNYTFCALNIATGLFDMISPTSNFTTLIQGDYHIYGLSYESSFNPNDIIGKTISQAYNLSNCFLLSSNYSSITITSPIQCPQAYSSANDNPLTGIVLADEDFETNGIIESDQIIGDINNPGGSPNTNIDVFYDSKLSILLQQGFETILGVSFEAFIDGCGNLFKDDDNLINK